MSEELKDQLNAMDSIYDNINPSADRGTEDKDKDKDNEDKDKNDDKDKKDIDVDVDDENKDVDDDDVDDDSDNDNDDDNVDTDDNDNDDNDDKDNDTLTISSLKKDIEDLKEIITNSNKTSDKIDKDNNDKDNKSTDQDKFEPQDFLSETTDLESLINSPEDFNTLLNNVLKKGIELGSAQKESILNSIPEIVKNNLQAINNLKDLSQKFYTENEDLKPFKKVVSTIFDETLTENPKLGYAEALKTVATETRKRLGLEKSGKKPDDSNPPKLPKKASQKRTNHQQKTNPFQDEIDAMDESLGF